MMKTIQTSTNTLLKGAILTALLTATLFTQAQSGPGGVSGSGGSQSIPELAFKNNHIESGTAGADGAVYRFENVGNNIDARIKIVGRSSQLVRISSIDLDNTGYSNAFQPQISYNNGNAPANTTWWADFDINFVSKGTTSPVAVSSFNLTAIDIDGDGGNLNEFVHFYNASSYLLENNSQLTVQSVTQLILDLLTPGRAFIGPKTNYTNIDVTATRVMTTLTYTNKNSFRVRAGGSTGNGSSSVADRMYSLWFKGFNFNTPVQITLPVKMVSFSATLNDDKANLKWTTASEINLSHFVVEKSLDGVSFTDAGVVFAYGDQSGTFNYSFVDNNINTAKAGMIYYRLRSVDKDGTTELSTLRMIRVGKQGEQLVKIVTYPNPATNELRITLPNSWQGKKVSYELVTNNGQVAMKGTETTSGQTQTLNISHLPTGFYVVKASCNDEVAQQKIIKQ